MNQSTYNKPLTLNELRAYQAGQLSAAEQHRIERLLLENPLYADALDGLDAIHQAGSSLHRQTRSLHEAFQERIHEAATPRRLMPLWVTSLVASVLLVLSVSFYLIYSTNSVSSARKSGPPAATHVVEPPTEPGTVLLDIKDLGSTETIFPVKKQAPSAIPTRKSGHKTAQRQTSKLNKSMPVAAAAVTPMSTSALPTQPQHADHPR